ncbi:MAG TPA: ATP-binding protein [archaeon]|nr:ATP-binding protein [archaeon]
MKEIGYALSGCDQRLLNFVVVETEKAKVNNYYFIKHPITNQNVLIRVYRTSPYNPEMITGRTGPLAGKKGRAAKYGKRLEYQVASAETLGFYDDERRWRGLELAPSPWDVVYEPDENELKEFFIPSEQATDAHYLEIGKVRGTKIPMYIDLNTVAKGHIFVAGMTRSGKSSFVINLAVKASNLKPKPRFIILDRRGEYGALTKYGAKVESYIRFRPPVEDPDTIAEMLGVSRDEKKIVVNAVNELAEEGKLVTRSTLRGKMHSVASTIIRADERRDNVLEFLDEILDKKGKFLDEQAVPADIVEVVLKTPILVVDFSVDADLRSQQAAAGEIINRIVKYAMERRNIGDFAAMVAIEEAQYLAPERTGMFEFQAGKPTSALVEGISQAGGYNVGFIVMTQRPAYVAKSVISQCNTVACFRLKSGNDQDAMMNYTEYGSETLQAYLPGLADHEAMLWGMAVPTPFPAIVEIKVTEYPKKAAVFAKQAWSRMDSS